MDLLKNADGNELEIDGKKLIFTINLIQDEFIQMLLIIVAFIPTLNAPIISIFSPPSLHMEFSL